MLSLPRRLSGLTVGLSLVVGLAPLYGGAEELDAPLGPGLDPEVWTAPLLAFQDSFGVQAPAHCLVDPAASSAEASSAEASGAEGEGDPAGAMPAVPEIDPLRCPELMQFGGGPAAPAAAPAWAASAWGWALEHWYLLAAPMPLAFVGGGGGGGGSAGAPTTGAPDLSDAPTGLMDPGRMLESGPVYSPVRPIPEPSTWALLIVGGALVGMAARRRI